MPVLLSFRGMDALVLVVLLVNAWPSRAGKGSAERGDRAWPEGWGLARPAWILFSSGDTTHLKSRSTQNMVEDLHTMF